MFDENDNRYYSKKSAWTKLLCGVILLYLAFLLIKGAVTAETITTVNLILCIVGAVLFVACGAFLIVKPFKTLTALRKEELEELNDGPDMSQPIAKTSSGVDRLAAAMDSLNKDRAEAAKKAAQNVPADGSNHNSKE